MKSIILCVWLLLPITVCGQEQKITVAVFDFTASGGFSKSHASTLTGSVRTFLVEAKKFQVLERERMNEVLKEQDFQLSDYATGFVKAGKLMGAEFIIVGSLGKIVDGIMLDLRLVEVETGKIAVELNERIPEEIKDLSEVMRKYFLPIFSLKTEIYLNEKAMEDVKEGICYLITDSRDNQQYRTFRIGKLLWMIDALRFNTGVGTFCYENDTSNCREYGSLYAWESARKALPEGWRLPTKNEWAKLLEMEQDTMEFRSWAIRRIISWNGWRDCSGIYDGKGMNAAFWCTQENGSQWVYNIAGFWSAEDGEGNYKGRMRYDGEKWIPGPNLDEYANCKDFAFSVIAVREIH